MKFKHISLLFVAAAAAFTACAGVETAVTDHRTTAGNFTAVQAEGPLVVEVHQNPDSAGMVVVRASERALPLVKIGNSDGTLLVRLDKSTPDYNRYTREIKNVTVYCGRELKLVSQTGSGILKINPLHTNTDLTAVLTGSGILEFYSASCLNFTGSRSGSGILKLAGIKARNVSTSGSGSGMITIDNVAATSFNCTVNGSGMATVSGTASKASLALHGSGIVNAKALKCPTLSVSVAGSGILNYNPSVQPRIISGRATGAGTIMK